MGCFKQLNYCDFFMWYDDELEPGSRERSIFDVIFDKMERQQGEVKGKEVTELELKRNLNEAQGNLMRKREKF